MSISYHVASELKDYGYTEDGESYIGDVYYIVAESKDGARWSEGTAFFGAERQDSEDCYGFVDTRQEAQKAANDLMASIEDGRSLSDWVELEPVYGSKAYCDYYGF